MKKFLRLLPCSFFLSFSSLFFFNSFSQCSYNNTYYSNFSPGSCPGSTQTTCTYGGEYISTNVVSGNTYTWSTCGDTDFDTQLTLYPSGGGASLAYNDDDCGNQSAITWTATFTGTVDVLLDQWNCTSNSTCMTINISCSGSGAGPANDDPCGAISLPVNSSCSYSSYTTSGATSTSGPPAPGCASYSGGDVWFSVTVPSSGSITINTNTGGITDGGMAIYSASSCSGSMTFLQCDDDGSTNGLMPMLTQSGLTPGATIYVRFWEYGNDNPGTFQICATPGSGGGGGCVGSGNTTCATADPFCTGTTYTYCNTTGTTSAGTYDCLTTTPNPAYYYLNIATSGPIDIYMEQFNNSGTGIDVDFALWGPFTNTSAACSAINANPNNNVVDCSYSTASTETANIPNAIVGQWYMLLITNYADQAGYIEFSQTGGTGATNCNIVSPCPVNAGSNSPLCATQTLNLTASNVTGATYSWTGPGGFTSSSQNPSISNVTTAMAGTYTVTVNAPGPCTSTSSVTVIVNSLPTVSVTPAVITVCNGYPVTLTASGANTYSWSPSSGLSATTGSSVTATPTSTTTYTVTGTTTATGCTNTATTTITVNPALTISVTPSAPSICPPASVSLTASGATTYSWSPSSGLSATTGATVTATPSSTTTYTVTGSSTNCNNASTTVTVTVNSTASGFTYNGNQCLTGNSFNFSNTGAMGGGVTYSWTFSSGTPATSTSASPSGITWSTPGTYAVSQTVTSGSCSSTTTQNITVYPLPAVTASGTNPLCNGVCTGSVSASGSGGTPGYTYTWSGSLGTGTPKSNVCAGTYTVTVSDGNGCTGTGSVTINNPPALSGTASATNASCNGVCSGTLSASGSGGASPYTYSWSGSLGAGATKSSVCAGTYTVTITDNNGCFVTASATVNQPASLAASASSTSTSCNGACNGTLTASATGGTTGYTYTWSGTLGTGASKTGVCAGTYTVTATDANGCTSTASATVNQPPALALTATGTNVSCNGGSNGSASVSVSGGTTSYSYSWSSGSTFSTATGLSAGTYTVTVTDANSCTSSTSVSISEPTAISATTSSANATCNGSANGSATVNPSGGTSPYTYQWDGGTGFQTAQTATGLAAGTYSVTITGAGGCTATASATISQPGATTVITSSTNSTCATANGSATATSSGGTSPYTYSWNTTPAQTAATATGLLAGSYTVTVSDANLCTTTATVTVSSAGAPAATISSSANVSCSGGNNGTATVTAVGGITPYTYLWSPSGGTNATANGLSAGTYCVNVTDNNNCVASACTTITEPPPLTGIPTGIVNAACNGTCNGSATISASGGVSPYNFTWQGGGTSATKTGLCAGSYNVTVTDANGCGIIVTATIAEPAPLTGSATGSSTSCNGTCDGDASLTAGGGTSPYTFLWDNGETIEDAIALCAGSHSVTITDINGCTGTTTVTINEPALLSLSSSSVNSSCGQSNGQVCITASGGTTGYTYSWNTSPVQTTSCATGTAAGSYTVTVTDANGCIATNTVIVNNSSGGTASASVNSNATGAGLCNGSATAVMTGGTSPYSYLWNTTPVQTTPTATGLCAGSNCVTVTDANGCSSTACVTISEPSAISAIAVPVNIQCFGDCNGSADLTVSGGTTPYTYLWSNGATAQDITNICAGSYTVTVTDANSNSTTANVTITSPTAVTVSTTPSNIVCNGICNGSIAITYSGGTEPYSFLWSNGQTTVNATGLCAGTYSVTVTDNFGCTGTASAVVTEPPSMTLSLSSSNANCGANDGSASVSAAGGTIPYSYSWSAGSTGSSQTGIAAGTYNVTVTDNNNCPATGSVVVNNNSAGTPSAVVDNNVLCNGGNNGQATASITGGTPPYTYKWGTTPMQTTPTATGLSAGTYSVTIIDANCSSVTSVTITEPAAITAAASATGAGCFGSCNGTATVSASGGTSPYMYQWDDGNFQTSATATGLCANNFSVTITDGNGCIATVPATVTQNADIVLSASGTQSTCNQADASASVSISSGVSPFNYQWDANAGSQTTSTATGLSANCYNVTVSDGNGCTKVANVCVTDAGAPSVSILTQTNVSCYNVCDGFAQISVSGGNPPYSYSWNTTPVQTTASAFNLCAGTYTGSMIDSTGCTASVSVTINQPASLSAIVSSQINPTCFNACNGTVNTITSGGTTPYSYAWNDPNAQTTPDATALCAGNYTLLITDAGLCDTSISVSITEPSPLTASGSSSDAICGTASGSACVTATGGTGSYSFLWNDPSAQTDSCAGNLVPGNYSVTVTDVSNCTATVNASVGDIPSGNASVSGVLDVSCNSLCDGEATVSMGGSGSSPYTYQWAASAGNQTTVTATGLCAGNHNVTITDANGCAASATAMINEPVAMSIISQTAVDVACFGQCNGAAAADVSGGTIPYSYLWNDPLSQTGKSATGLCAGSYTVTITDANNCFITSTITVAEPAELTLNTTSLNANCNQSNGSGCVIASGGTTPYSYLWQSGNINPCAASLAAGIHNVTVTDGNNCVQIASVLVQNINGPNAVISSQTNINCNGNCNGSITASASGGVSPYNFQWGANTGNQITPTASNLCGGMYTVTITDSAGCSVSASATINEPAIISFNQQTNDPLCFGSCNGSASVTVTGGTTPYSFLWSDSQTNDTAFSLCAGSFILTITDANSCVEILNYTLANPAQITTSMNTVAASCNGVCDGKATVTPANGNAPYAYLWSDINSQTSQQANGLCAGNYSVTVTDNNGCTGTSSGTVSQPSAISASINNSGNVSCSGQCNGYAQVDVSGGTPSYTYLWSNNSISQVNSNLCAGNYTVTVTDLNNCTSTASISIIQPAAFSSSVTGTNVACGGDCDGQAALSPSGGAAPYAYLWSANTGFQSTQTATGLCGGNYAVTITDGNGCQIYKNISIFEPMPLGLIVNNKSDANCGQNNGFICTSVTGGSAPYTYQWNDPTTQTSACALFLYAGCYSLNITDANGCVADTLVCLNDIAGPTVAVDTSMNVTCYGANNGTIDFNVTGGMTPYDSIQWYNGAGILLPAYSGLTIANTLPGGTYTLIVTDAAGCISTLSQSILEPNQILSAVTSFTNVTCNGSCNGSATVGVAGGTPPYSYSWTGGQTSSTATGLCAGIYTLTITDINQCNKTQVAQITEPAPVSITASTIDNSCNSSCDGGVTLSTTGGTTPYYYNWSPAAAGPNDASAFNLCSGTYSTTITDANGCTSTHSSAVSEPLPVAATAAIISATCSNCNGQALITGSGGTSPYNYIWGTGQQGANALNLCPGVNLVTVTDMNGCSFDTTLNISDSPSPQITGFVISQPSCYGMNNGSATVIYSGGTGGFVITWSNNQTGATVGGLSVGTYNVVIMDANQCAVSQSVNITQPSAVTAIGNGSDTICYGQTTQIWASGAGGSGPYTITWTGSASNLSGTGPHNVSPLADASYTFTVYDTNNCSANGVIQIFVNDPLEIEISTTDSVLCSGDSVSICAGAQGGSGLPYSYQWSNGTLDSCQVVSPQAATSYSVILSDGCSLNDTDQIQITINPMPQVNFNSFDTAFCPPLTINFTSNIIPSGMDVNYQWDFNEDGIFDSDDPLTAYPFSESGIYDITLIVSTDDNCQDTMTRVNYINVYPSPVAGFTATPMETSVLNPDVDFDASILTIGADSIAAWDFGDNTNDTGLTILHHYNDTGSYLVTLTAINKYGCISDTSQIVVIKEDFAIFVPNAFSPNTDGKNDFFFPEGVGINPDKFKMWIFDRWGDIIFETNNVNTPWDGTAHGGKKPVQIGVYVWLIETENDEGKKERFLGHVTVYR